MATPSLSTVPDSTLAAVERQWNADATLLSVAGPLYLDQVPEQDAQGNPLSLPYSTVHLGKSTLEFSTEAAYWETADLTFEAWCAGAASAEQAVARVRQVFDWQPLPFLDPEHNASVAVMPLDYSVDCEFTRYKDGSLVYRACVRYAVTAQRTLPPINPA